MRVQDHVRVDAVDALAAVFGHPIAGMVDDVRVVAGAAAHLIDAALAVDVVVAGIADDLVAVVVAVQEEVRRTIRVGGLQPFDVGAGRQRKVGAGPRDVEALAA